ncbi:transcriptional regulator with XRE-family HTH domain [Parabacteroides sp. PFB2-10]|uniref:helix-turn-helix domain-containing protein n=1 Tax=Parabacteroides sp. PFB2-10 TaxID=1742405 RepID=UPI002476D454|nr:helix-turn-helix domain-containing protein [Parabacteroides sp. PFB2-10]MDH6313239.1 transcriptional regulator with XRE-family HTH domain [Parabacteroides sp. PFB2-10]
MNNMTIETLHQKVKELRIKNGMSQEELADKAGISLRTVQRIENGESVPRGDTLKRLAEALKVNTGEILEIQEAEDNNLLIMLQATQFGFLFFPVLGIVIPLIIWILKKDVIVGVDSIGKSILNFQITWNLIVFASLILFMMFGGSIMSIIFILYFYNSLIIVLNIILTRKNKRLFYKPSIPLLK